MPLKLSSPLARDIATGEGIAEWLLGVAVFVLTACGDLSVTKGVTTATILAVVKGARRLLLKGIALQKGLGIPTPTAFLPGSVSSHSRVLDLIADAEATIGAFQNTAGTAPGDIKAGLAPTDPPAEPAAGEPKP